MSIIAQEYWEQLKNIQNNQAIQLARIGVNQPFIDIDLNSRQIILPPEYADFLSVETDHRAETIYFRVNRFFDDVDLTKTTIIIEYVNAQGDSRIYPVVLQDRETYSDKIIFGWCIGNDATRYAGTIQFAVRFYSINQTDQKFDYNLNTLVAEGTILHGIGDMALEENYVYETSIIESLIHTVESSRLRWIDV